MWLSLRQRMNFRRFDCHLYCVCDSDLGTMTGGSQSFQNQNRKIDLQLQLLADIAQRVLG